MRQPGNRLAFEHLFDQIDTPARPVELVTEQLIGRAGGVAETAVHTSAQDGVGLAAVVGILDEVGEMGFHARLFRNPDTGGRG